MTHTRELLLVSLARLAAVLLVCVANPCASLDDGGRSPAGMIVDDAEGRETPNDFDDDRGDGWVVADTHAPVQEWQTDAAGPVALPAPRVVVAVPRQSRAPPASTVESV